MKKTYILTHHPEFELLKLTMELLREKVVDFEQRLALIEHRILELNNIIVSLIALQIC
jgi:hypothetical protein